MGLRVVPKFCFSTATSFNLTLHRPMATRQAAPDASHYLEFRQNFEEGLRTAGLPEE